MTSQPLPPRNFVYVDNSNVYIEGQRASAVAQGLNGVKSLAEAMRRNTVDGEWKLNYWYLHQFIASPKAAQVGHVKLWASSPELSHPIWEVIGKIGYQVNFYERNIVNREKKIDTALAYHVGKDAFSGVIKTGYDEITLVAGDKDYVPVVADLLDSGHKVSIVFWDSAAAEMQAFANRVANPAKFVSLTPHLHHLTMHTTPAKAPPVPASARV